MVYTGSLHYIRNDQVQEGVEVATLSSCVPHHLLPQDSGDLFSPVDTGVSARSLQQDLNPERIVGGSEVKAQGLYPFSVSLKIRTRSGYVESSQCSLLPLPSRRYLHFCGGAAITTSAILTAAHCVQTTPRSSLYVSIGEHDIKSVGENERLIKVRDRST